MLWVGLKWHWEPIWTVEAERGDGANAKLAGCGKESNSVQKGSVRLEGLGADDVGREDMELGTRALPSVGGEAHLFGAEAGEELLFGPAGLAGDLRQETAAPAVDRQVDPIVEWLKVQRVGGGAEGEDDGNLQLQMRQLLGGDGVIDESGVLEDGLGHVLDGGKQGLGGVEAADAAAKAMGGRFVKGDETACGLEEHGVEIGGRVGAEGREGVEMTIGHRGDEAIVQIERGGVSERAEGCGGVGRGLGTEGAADGGSRQVQEDQALVGGEVHGVYRRRFYQILKAGDSYNCTAEERGQNTGDRRQKTEYRRQETGDYELSRAHDGLLVSVLPVHGGVGGVRHRDCGEERPAGGRGDDGPADVPSVRAGASGVCGVLPAVRAEAVGRMG